jgi:hypothetical protein
VGNWQVSREEGIKEISWVRSGKKRGIEINIAIGVKNKM